jgi:hypothetical protein
MTGNDENYGSGRIDHKHNLIAVAMPMAEREVWAHRS